MGGAKLSVLVVAFKGVISEHVYVFVINSDNLIHKISTCIAVFYLVKGRGKKKTKMSNSGNNDTM